MKRYNVITIAIICFAVIGLGLGSALAADQTNWKEQAENALRQVVSEIELSPGDRNLLVLTNAGYGRVNTQSTEAFLDVAHEITGCSVGERSLLAVHASVFDPLWFALFRKDTGKIVFVKWSGSQFERQHVDASPDKILTPQAWQEAGKGLIGSNLFSVVSISLTWAVDPPWSLLLAATYHDHFCPGLNSGYIIGQYVMKNLAPGSGDKYVFATAPAKCAADALQVMFNTTSGKSGGYAMAIDGKKLGEYALGDVTPMTVAMRVNNKKDECAGLVLGFDWSKAYATTGVKPDELHAKGGGSNPMFWVARVKMSSELARQPKEKLMDMIVVMKSFNGPAALADQIGAGDPYATAFK
jgi:formylmethanofuran dehydrogenase subunit E-like metal-binding protein